MIATSGKPGASDAKDPVDKESSRVQAVGVLLSATDFLNYGTDGRDVFQALQAELASFKAPFDFHELDRKTGQLVLIQDPAKAPGNRPRHLPRHARLERRSSHAHLPRGCGQARPLQQAQVMEKKLREAGVTVKLVTKPGAGHGWPEFPKDLAVIADWFDVHLAKPEPKKSGSL